MIGLVCTGTKRKKDNEVLKDNFLPSWVKSGRTKMEPWSSWLMFCASPSGMHRKRELWVNCLTQFMIISFSKRYFNTHLKMNNNLSWLCQQTHYCQQTLLKSPIWFSSYYISQITVKPITALVKNRAFVCDRSSLLYDMTFSAVSLLKRGNEAARIQISV